MLKTYAGVLLLSLFFITSCSKSEGEGGTSEINGKVYLIRYESGYQFARDTFPAREEDVYIVYGSEGLTYNDDFKTSLDGSYSFRNLIEGSYRVFVYTKDSTGASTGLVDNSLPKVPIMHEVRVGTDERTSVQDIYILDNDH